MKLISATLITAAGAAAAMLWMNKDRYLNRRFHSNEEGRTDTAGSTTRGSDFLGEGAPVAPATPVH